MPAGPTANPMRARFRRQVRDDVKRVALGQLATGGPQAISLNAIARELGVSGPALYRYVAGRDELLTALVVDAYDDLRDALAGALEAGAPPASARAARPVTRVARAYRQWALAQPHRYDLLFKPPIPGYDAHADERATAARSLMGVLLAASTASVPGGASAPDAEPGGAPPAYSHDAVLAERGSGSARFGLAVSVWSCLHGVASLECGGSFAAMRLDADALFEREVQVLEERIARSGPGSAAPSPG
ncbi:TetR/AcrR family transcriptional regulator [Agilicoccus flavus]|uniref:TetR/AcrR family transcriptional regulator n=1 Tax=Agilicoccus flavus TaxID=2775968 RepID=UPI001CF6161E|nr:TetR/AcrR family transcriptional regulator [Agilicoccus flavus]